jgi:hypothetical protein
MFPAIGTDPAAAALASEEPRATGRPLAAFVDATQGSVQEVLDVTEPEMCFTAIARLSGHLAAMWRAVYPSPGGRLGADRQLRAACLRRARTVGWTLRLLECQLSGEASSVGLPVTAVSATLAEHLGSYRSAEQALITWLEDQLPAEGRDKLALGYGRALSHAPTRPHPRCPRTGPLRCVAFWLFGRWDRVLDTMDSRPGVGRGFPALASRQGSTPGTGGHPA